jgi:hypothetical protein
MTSSSPIGSRTGRLDHAAVVVGIDRYLDRLEAALRSLARGAPGREVMRQVKSADRQYDRSPRSAFVRSGAYVKYRYRIIPPFPPTSGLIGLADERSGFSYPEMLEVVRFVMQKFDWRKDAAAIAAVARLLRQFLSTQDSRDLSIQRRRFNQFMQHSDVLQSWSVLCGEMEPAQNRFRELVFEYA